MAVDPKVLVASNGAPPVGPYSPGLETAEYVYVSGQGVRNAKNEMASGIDAQAQQCVDNVRVILEAGGLSLANVVSVQLFLADLNNLPAVDRIYDKAFTSHPPRVILGVNRMPTDTTVEITVVAKKNMKTAGDRVYLPAVYGATADEAKAKLGAELKKAGLTPKSVLFANHYAVGSTAAGVVPMQALPDGARHAIFAIAAKKKPADLAFCDVTASDPAGSVEDQTANVFGKLKSCLAAKGMTLANAVATNVYVDDLVDFTKMNGVYAMFFPAVKPTRTTVQPLSAAKSGSLVRISVVAAK